MAASSYRPSAYRDRAAISKTSAAMAASAGSSSTTSSASTARPASRSTRSVRTEADVRQYPVMTSGRYGPTPAWHFASTDAAPEVIGDIFLALIVAVPSNAESTASITVSAEAQLKSVPFAVPLLTRRTANNLHQYTFPLRAKDV